MRYRTTTAEGREDLKGRRLAEWLLNLRRFSPAPSSHSGHREVVARGGTEACNNNANTRRRPCDQVSSTSYGGLCRRTWVLTFPNSNVGARYTVADHADLPAGKPWLPALTGPRLREPRVVSVCVAPTFARVGQRFRRKSPPCVLGQTVGPNHQ